MVKACQIVLPVAASSARNQRYFGRTAGGAGADEKDPLFFN
jgi:hypothetical protein